MFYNHEIVFVAEVPRGWPKTIWYWESRFDDLSDAMIHAFTYNGDVYIPHLGRYVKKDFVLWFLNKHHPKGQFKFSPSRSD